MHSSSEGVGEYFHVNLCTYRDLRPAGSAVVSFVEMAVEMARRSGLEGLRVSVERVGGRRSRGGRALTRAAWEDTRAAIDAGDYANVLLFNAGSDVAFALTIRAEDVYAALLERVRDQRARERLEAARRERPSPRFLNLAMRGLPSEFARVVEAACEAQRAIHGDAGFITLDPVQFISGDQTQFELARVRHWSAAPDMFRTNLRGVFWGNFLGAAHVAALGGMERVLREAPCETIEPLGDAAYLQSSAQPSTPSAALAGYLDPLLG